MLDAILAGVREREKQFVVYGADETTAADLFSNHNVSLVYRDLPAGGPSPFLVVEDGGRFAGAVSLDDLDGLFSPPLVRPGEGTDVSPGYRVLFEVLDDTVFTSMERAELLAVSREIEDRAFRVGRGTLRTSFQRLSVFESQLDVYRRLADVTDLAIHVHGAPDWDPPEIAGVTYHEDAADDVERYWVVAFDGGDDAQACALLAVEEGDGYRGFWTDDPAVVADVLAALAAQ